MRRVALALALSALGVPVAFSGGAGGDAAKIQGTYSVVAGTRFGEAIPKSETEKLKIVITADKFIFRVEGRDEGGNYRLDPSMNPKQIDLIERRRTDNGSGTTETETKPKLEVKRTALPGIYELTGDELKIAISEEKERPKDFRAVAKHFIVLILKRDSK